MIHGQIELRRMQSDLAAMHMHLVLLRWTVDRKYNPDQPRVPAGDHDGGRWIDGEAYSPDATGGAGSRNVQVAENITGFTRHGIKPGGKLLGIPRSHSGCR